MSQPNLSQSIKQLECEIGSAIFERTPSGLVPTAFGQEYIHRMQILHAEINALEEFCQNDTEKQKTLLNIAVSNCTWVSPFFSSIISQHSGKSIDFSLNNFENPDTVLLDVQTALYDIGILNFVNTDKKEIYKKINNFRLTYTKLFTSPLHLVFGEKNPLFDSKTTVTLEDVYGYPFVSYGTPKQITSSFFSRHLDLPLREGSFIRVNTHSALLEVIRSTQAFSIFANSLQFLNDKRVRCIPLNNLPYYFEIGWVKPQRMELSKPALDLLQLIMNSVSTYLDK